MTYPALTEETPAGFGLKDARTGEGCRLALQELWLTGRLLPVGAHLMVRHTFQSAEEKPLEMIYAFALPRDAALRRFRVAGAGFSVRSELRPVAEAQRRYEEGIDGGHLSTMARMYRDGLVNLNVGNIAPGEAVTVWLELVAGVESRDDGFRFRFPFTLAPAYHREARAFQNEEGLGELELPEGEFGDLILPTWSKDARGLHRVGFSLSVSMPGGAIKEVASPSHPLRVRPGEAGQARALLGTAADLPNRDLVLDVRAAVAQAGIFTGLDGEGRARVAAVIPSGEFGGRPAGARRIVFLLDRSGSMEGAPIEQARRALAACLSVIEPADQFAIVAFDNYVETFKPQLSDGASEGRQAAKQFLAGIQARGGTELLAGILEGVRLLAGRGGEILVLTDGQVAGTEPIIKAARQAGVRIHCLGIGSASQDRFLALLARETGGVSRFLTARERVDMAALELFAALGRPVAGRVRFAIEGLAGGQIDPAPPEAVYGGTPVTLFARAEGAGAGRLVATWEADGTPRRREFALDVGSGRLGETIKLLQGARLITEAQVRSGEQGSRPGKLDRRQQEREERRLEQLSREYGLASQAMALVAVLERAADQAGRLPETRVVTVGMPEDTAFGAYFPSPVSAGAIPCAPLPPMGFADCDPYDIPPLHRRRKMSFFGDSPSPMPAPAAARAAAPATPEDTLVELAARLEGDGGLPGKNPQERVMCTMAALLCFPGQGGAAGQGPFSRHLALMIKFLEVSSLPALGEAFERVKRQLLDAAAAGEAVPGDWLALARRLIIDRKVSADEAWQEIRQRFK